MGNYNIVVIKNKKVWENFVLSKNPHTFLQSWNWGEVKRSLGNKIFRLGIKNNGRIVGVCLVIKEVAKRGSYLIIPAGPVMDWEDEKLVKYFLRELKKLAKKEKVWFIRIRPELEDSSSLSEKFKNMKFVPSPMHVHAENTWVLDITKSDEDLLLGMRKSTRYLVRKSLRSGLKLTISSDPKKADLLYKLQEETASRHNFIGFSKKIFTSEISFFGRDDQAKVLICSYKEKPLAAAIVVFYGNSAYYHYSGSVSDFNKLPFSYFLQWHIIQQAKKRGLNYYNFWGIAPNDDPNHRFAGVTLFKTGFGGRRLDWLHARDFPVSPLYWLTFVFETFRHIYRRL